MSALPIYACRGAHQAFYPSAALPASAVHCHSTAEQRHVQRPTRAPQLENLMASEEDRATTTASRSDLRAASGWLAEHRPMAALMAALACACAVVLLLSPASTAKRAIGVPLFGIVAAYLAYKALCAPADATTAAK